MHVQSGRGEDEDGVAFGEDAAGEISEALEVAAAMMPADPRPVIEALHGKMEILGGLEFDDRQAAVAGDAQQIDDGAVGGGKGGHLRVEQAWGPGARRAG